MTLKPIQYFSHAVLVFLKGKWPSELHHVPRYLVLEWLSTFVFSRKNTFVDLLGTTLVGHAHLHADWTFHDLTGLWRSFRGRWMTQPCDSRMDQYGPINVCLALLSAVMESHVVAEYKNGQCDVESLLHKIDCRWTEALHPYDPPRSVMMSWSWVMSAWRAARTVWPRGHGRCLAFTVVMRSLWRLIGSQVAWLWRAAKLIILIIWQKFKSRVQHKNRK